MAKKLSILDKTFQLALLLHRRTAEFNRKYKFTIGDRIDVVAEEAQEMILRANHQTDPKRAAQIIYDFVLRIDTLSLKLRMAVALGLMSDDAKAQCDMLIAIRREFLQRTRDAVDALRWPRSCELRR